MNGDPVVVRTYPNEVAAELARAILESEGIVALVSSHDAAGLLRYVHGVQLIVRRDELEAARAILERREAEASWDDE
jgi:hypothetical protein